MVKLGCAGGIHDVSYFSLKHRSYDMRQFYELPTFYVLSKTKKKKRKMPSLYENRQFI